MKVSVLPNSLVFEGVFDEKVTVEELENSLGVLNKAGLTPPVNLDFSKVIYANSAGVVVWLKFMRQSKISFKYINAPVWLVNQFNIINSYFENKSFVESINVPYFCAKTQDSRAFTLKLGKEIPLLSDYSNFSLPNRKDSGKDYQADITSERYFSFISDNLAAFKEKIK